MLKAHSKIFVVLVMLIAVIGQVAASTAMYYQVPDNERVTISQEHTHNDPHQHSTDNKVGSESDCCDTDCCDSDCCELGCYGMNCVCPVNASTLVIYLSIDMGLFNFFAINEPIDVPRSDHKQSILTSLYRPPIFTS